MKKNLFAAVVLLIGSVACASAPTGGSSINMQVITQAEVEKTTAKNALEVVRKLRPNYLRGRGQITINAPQGIITPNVYLNGQVYGSIDALASIPATTIAEIRLYHAGEVPAQWEQNNPNGLIAVKTK